MGKKQMKIVMSEWNRETLNNHMQCAYGIKGPGCSAITGRTQQMVQANESQELYTPLFLN